MYSFIDENESFVVESKNEAFGYVPNNLKLDSFISNINISLFKENPQKLKLDRKRERGLVYELTYSKYIKNVNVIFMNNQHLMNTFINSLMCTKPNSFTRV